MKPITTATTKNTMYADCFDQTEPSLMCLSSLLFCVSLTGNCPGQTIQNIEKKKVKMKGRSWPWKRKLADLPVLTKICEIKCQILVLSNLVK